MTRLLLLALAAVLATEAAMAQNLLQNPDAEAPIVGGQIPGWTIVSGNWRYRGSDPAEFEGSNYFFAGPGSGTAIGETTELQQDVDVSAYAAAIDAGSQPFTFAGYIRAINDEARVTVEYQTAAGAVLASYDSGIWTADTHWELLHDVRLAPAGTRTVRVRLLTTYLEPTNNSGYFDALTLAPVDATALSTFDASAEAWRIDGDPVTGTFGWVAGAGNPGGALQVTDANTGILIVWMAPPAFLADQSARYGGTLHFDRITSTLVRSFTVPDDVRLLGDDGVLLTYDMPDGTEPGLDWTSGSVPLSEVGWTNTATGLPATPEEFQAALADVERLDIVAEYSSEPETNRLDNVAYEGGAVSAENGPDSAAPLAIASVAPNPFATRATVTLRLLTDGLLAVDVIDALGRRVAVLHDGPLAAGTHPLTFDAAALPSGTYLVRATAEGTQQTCVVTHLRAGR